MGLRLIGADGRKLRWADGFYRYVWMLWSAYGFYIPVLEIIQLYRSFERCRREETQLGPGDDLHGDHLPLPERGGHRLVLA